MSRLEAATIGIAFAFLATPAFAGSTTGVPAPVVGVGVGAVVLIGVGYRALKNRFHS